MKTKLITMLLGLTVSVFVVGCGDDDSPTGSSGVADFEETQVTDASCVPSADGMLDCVAALELAVGTWRYQWHVQYGQSGKNPDVITTPDPPEQAFTVARASEQKPAI